MFFCRHSDFGLDKMWIPKIHGEKYYSLINFTQFWIKVGTYSLVGEYSLWKKELHYVNLMNLRIKINLNVHGK